MEIEHNGIKNGIFVNKKQNKKNKKETEKVFIFLKEAALLFF